VRTGPARPSAITTPVKSLSSCHVRSVHVSSPSARCCELSIVTLFVWYYLTPAQILHRYILTAYRNMIPQGCVTTCSTGATTGHYSCFGVAETQNVTLLVFAQPAELPPLQSKVPAAKRHRTILLGGRKRAMSVSSHNTAWKDHCIVDSCEPATGDR
jgi:hypothetical protein